jgi:predicted RNA binding protein YcfA (HicA-like mRNA interferase family)
VYSVEVTSRDIIDRLKVEGWILVNVRGSHHQYKHPISGGKVTVPHPKKDLPKGTLRNIFRQTGWDWPPR